MAFCALCGEEYEYWVGYEHKCESEDIIEEEEEEEEEEDEDDD